MLVCLKKRSIFSFFNPAPDISSHTPFDFKRIVSNFERNFLPFFLSSIENYETYD